MDVDVGGVGVAGSWHHIRHLISGGGGWVSYADRAWLEPCRRGRYGRSTNRVRVRDKGKGSVVTGNPDGRGVVQRACARCGAGLRRGHSGGVCDPCARRPSDIAERLREARFFTREPIRRALAAYDFGYLFRAVRRTAELTQVEFGEVLELDQDRISRIERGERQLKDFETIVRVASLLGIPLMLLGFSTTTMSVVPQSAAPAHDLPTKAATGGRLDDRHLLESSVKTNKLSAQESDLLAQADQTRHMMDRAIAERTVTPAQVDKIDHMVRLHAQACVTMPPLVMLRRLVADFDELRGLVSQVQSPTTLVRLYAYSAQIGALIADELMVLGDTHRAWAWHHSATVAADETRLPDLGLQVRSLGILIPLYSGDSREALSMAVDACNLSGSIVDRSSPAYVLAITLKALILAQLGSIDECRAALGESGESFARLDRAGKTDSVFGFSERRWRFYRARTLAELGEFDEAWEAQDRALELYTTDVVGDPTIIRLDRALCLVRGNDIDAGCELAADVLSSLPLEHHASIFLECGKKILSAIPGKYSNRRSVSHYRAAIVESCQVIGVM